MMKLAPEFGASIKFEQPRPAANFISELCVDGRIGKEETAIMVAMKCRGAARTSQ
jgi:hypothetical protein